MACDWPLSREEKLCRIIELYEIDLDASNRQLSSSEELVHKLRHELACMHQLHGTRSKSGQRSLRYELACLHQFHGQRSSGSSSSSISSIAGVSSLLHSARSSVESKHGEEAEGVVASSFREPEPEPHDPSERWRFVLEDCPFGGVVQSGQLSAGKYRQQQMPDEVPPASESALSLSLCSKMESGRRPRRLSDRRARLQETLRGYNSVAEVVQITYLEFEDSVQSARLSPEHYWQ